MKDQLMVYMGVLILQKKISIKTSISKANTKFYLRLHRNDDESYLYVNKTEIYYFKTKNIISWYVFV